MPKLGVLSYSDTIRFFELFPQVSYIYDHMMTNELQAQFQTKVMEIIKSRQLPPEDVCRIFNILATTTPYATADTDKVLHEVLGRLRHSLYSIPKEHLPLTMTNLIEMQ